tara:strand:+ start:5554 stop:5979 length:426 start_codon:yes stop_codon:yes gene_type:complete
MANEARINSSLSINNGSLKYRSGGGAFNADVAGAFGPVPGAITATTQGVDIDLSSLIAPGLCQVTNLDSANAVKIGRYDSDNLLFFPFLYLLPGETFTFRLDSDIEDEYSGTATSTTSGSTTLRAKGVNSSVDIFFGAFES